MKKKVYLAGKIKQTCWRHSLIPDLRNHKWEGGPIATDLFTYVGPFFVGCDHGCYHGPTSHGALGGNSVCAETLADRALVIKQCREAVADCEMLFAYINEHHCYGTVAEITLALHLKKIVVVAIAPGIASPAANDFWFVTHFSRAVLFDVTEAKLPRILDMALQMSCRGETL